MRTKKTPILCAIRQELEQAIKEAKELIQRGGGHRIIILELQEDSATHWDTNSRGVTPSDRKHKYQIVVSTADAPPTYYLFPENSRELEKWLNNPEDGCTLIEEIECYTYKQAERDAYRAVKEFPGLVYMNENSFHE